MATNPFPRDFNRAPVIGGVDSSTNLAVPATIDHTTGGLNVNIVGGSGSVGTNATIVSPLGSQVSAASVSVVVASDQGTIPVGGAIQTQAYSSSASGPTTVLNCAGYSYVSVDIQTDLSSGGTGFQISNDNTNWRALLLTKSDASDFANSPGNTNSLYGGFLYGAKYFRLNITGSTGTAAGTIVLSTLPQGSLVSAVRVSAGTTTFADGNSNAISSPISAGGSSVYYPSYPFVFNGSTWDRLRSTSTGVMAVDINDGTNSGNILKSDGTAAGQNALMTSGTGYTTSTISLSAGTQNSTWYDTLNYASVSVEILTNTTPATITFQTSGDSGQTNIRTTSLQDSQTNSTAVTNTTSAVGIFSGSPGGRYFRISTNLAGGNTATFVITFYTNTRPLAVIPSSFGSNSATGSAVPANAFYIALKDNGGNLDGLRGSDIGDGHTTTDLLANMPYSFNGSTGDRLRNNFNTTTGDTPTIVSATTTNGATQTNYNARGAIITAILGTVSGTTPAIQMQLQWSPDAGTTWLSYGTATTSLTVATGNTLAIAIYPTTITATLLGTTNSSDNTQINAPLPRTWRVIYITTGIGISIAVASVNVNYIL